MHSNNNPTVVYLPKVPHPSATVATAQPNIVQLHQACTNIIITSTKGTKLEKKPYSNGDPLQTVYMVFYILVQCISQLQLHTAISTSTNITVMELIVDATAPFSQLVWTIIDIGLQILVHHSLLLPGNPKDSLKQIRESAQLDNKVNQLLLLGTLFRKADETSQHVQYWKETQRLCDHLKITSEEVLISRSLDGCGDEQIRELRRCTDKGEPITWEMVQRTKFQYPQNNKSPNTPETPKHTKTAFPRLQAIQPQNEAYCSAEICDFAHGTKPCPFLQGRCRNCTNVYSKEHKVYGRCVQARMDFINIDGTEYRRVPFVNRGGNRENAGGGKGWSEYKTKCSEEPSREQKPRKTLNTQTKPQVKNNSKIASKTKASLPLPEQTELLLDHPARIPLNNKSLTHVLIQAEVENCITELIHQIEKQSDIYTITTNATVPHSHCTEDNKKTKKAEDDTTHLCAHDPKPHGFPLINKKTNE